MRFLALLVLLPALSKADEILQIRSLHVTTDIRFRFARTLITSQVANPSNTYAYVVFHVTLPNSAFITDFRFFSVKDKKWRVGSIDERQSAKQRFSVQAALGEPVGYIGVKNETETNIFEVTLYAQANDKMTFNLTYEEVLQRQQGLYKHDLYIDPGQPVLDMTIDVAIQESRDITTLKTPLMTGITDIDITGDRSLVVVQRPSPKSAYIRFSPTLDQQLSRWAEGISGVFSVMYDVDRGFDAGDILVSNGYFIHFFAPAVPNPVPKDVLFILDTSTSMFWGKLDQLKAAMTVILNDLNPDDRFNIISFGSRIHFWQDSMAEAKQKTNIQRAIEYLDGLKALGWTNIKESIGQGVDFLNKHSRNAEGSLIIFLTDGHATAGEISPKAILEHVKRTNSKDIPLYTMAFGKDADWDLVKMLAIQNFGIAKRIYKDGNATIQIQDFYNTVANTMLHGVTFQYSNTVLKSTKTNFGSYAEGVELIVAGKLDAEKNLDTLTPNVIATSSSGGVSLKPAHLVVDLKAEFQNLTSLYDDDYNMERMTRRMWAYLYIKDILKKRVAETNKSQCDKLEQEALKLSLEHKLVTPMTSMVVDSPYDQTDRLTGYNEDDDDLYYHEKTTYTTPAPPSYYSYYNRRGSNRGGAGWDPHFMVYMEGLKYPICFDVHGEDNQIYQLLRDPQEDLTVNVRMAQGKKNKRAYYMTEVAIMHHDLHLQVTCSSLNLHDVAYPWNTDYNGTIPGARLYIKTTSPRLSKMSVVFDTGFQIDITRHIRKWEKGQDFLNIELGNEQLLSLETDGLLGQFIHKKMRLEDVTYKDGHLLGHLVSRTGLEVEHGRAQIVHREDPVWQTTISCWLIKKMGVRLFDGPAEYYIVSDMSKTELN